MAVYIRPQSSTLANRLNEKLGLAIKLSSNR